MTYVGKKTKTKTNSDQISQEERRRHMLEERRQRELDISGTEQLEPENSQRAESDPKELPQAASPPNSPVCRQSTTLPYIKKKGR